MCGPARGFDLDGREESDVVKGYFFTAEVDGTVLPFVTADDRDRGVADLRKAGYDATAGTISRLEYMNLVGSSGLVEVHDYVGRRR